MSWTARQLTLLLVFIGIAFYWPCLFGQSSFYLTDVNDFFEPLTRYCVDRIRHGEWPLWNPYCYCGMSQIAIQSPSVWYLPNVLFLPFSFTTGLALTLIFHEVIAGLGAYFLILQIPLSRRAASFGALLAAFNGFMFSMETNWTMAAGCAWLPWALLFVQRIATIGGAREIAFFAISIALLVTTGRPEVVLPGLALIAGFAIYATRSGGLARLLQIILGGLIGLALAAPMILPALEWLPLSRRAGGLDPQEVMLLRANWYDLAKIVSLPWLGDQRLAENISIPFVVQSGSVLVASAFLGPIPLFLAGYAFLDKSWKGRWLALATLVIGLIFSVGLLPIFSFARFPIKLIWMPAAVLIAAAARGLERISSNLVATLLAALASGLLLINGWMVGRHWASSGFFTAPSIAADTVRSLNVDLTKRRVTGLFHRQNFIQPPWLMTGDASARAIARGEYDRQTLNPNTNIDAKVPSAWGFEASCLGQYYRVFYTALSMSTQSTGITPEDMPKQKDDEPLAKLMREASVGIVTSQLVQVDRDKLRKVPELDPRFFKLLKRDEAGNLTYYEVLDSRPRIYIENGTTRVLVDRPELVQIATDSPVETKLILSDTHYPGWQGTIDNVPTVIEKQDEFFRSVRVWAGKHIVSFQYNPYSWKLGLLLAALGACGLLGCLLIDHKQRKTVKESM